MSNRTPDQDDGHSSVPFFFSAIQVCEQLRLPQFALRRKLFKILRKAGQNLEAELCPCDPKSICTKAQDLARNLPHWKDQIDEQFVSANGEDLSHETDVYVEVLGAAIAVKGELVRLVNSGSRDHPLAEQKLAQLKATLVGALEQLNTKFTIQGMQRPDTASKSSVAKGATHTRSGSSDLE
jgi:hypothetical protein